MSYDLDLYDIFEENDSQFVHVDELTKYDDAKEILKKILKLAYVTGDTLTLEDKLEELCGIFEIKLPRTKLLLRGN